MNNNTSIGKKKYNINIRIITLPRRTSSSVTVDKIGVVVVVVVEVVVVVVVVVVVDVVEVVVRVGSRLPGSRIMYPPF